MMTRGTMMRAQVTMAAATAVVLVLAAQPVRAGEECDSMIETMDEAVQVVSKVTDLEVAEITKNKPETDAQKASVKNRFCRVSGEFLGTSRAYRAVSAECLQGSKRRTTLASLDAAIKQVEDSIAQTCK
jgi:hypothetical protein